MDCKLQSRTGRHAQLNLAMIKNYLIVAWRNIQRSKLGSLINIFGLTAGTVCCLYIVLYVNEQYDFDQHHQDVDRIFRLTTEITTKAQINRMATISTAILPSIQEDFPEVEQAVRVMNRADVDDHLFRTDQKSIFVNKGYYADSNFFKVFTYRFVEGSMDHALDKPLAMVISSAVASNLFGDESAINKVITMTDRFGTNDFIITGVFDDSFGRSHVRPNFVMNIYSGRFGYFVGRSTSWAWDNGAHGYVKLKPGVSAEEFETKVSNYISSRAKGELDKLGYSKQIHLQAIRDVHVSSNLESEIDKNSNSKFLVTLIIIGALVQFIACVNFMNLSTARSARRAKEIGIRKSAGAVRASLIKQFILESLLLTIIAASLALPTLYTVLPIFNQISQYNLSPDIFNNGFTWAMILGLVVVTGLFAGSYPAFYLSSFRAIEALKGNSNHHVSASSLRKGLVVFQFAISVGLIIIVMVIRTQVEFMHDKDLGFNKEQKLVIPFRSRDARDQSARFKDEIRKWSAVKNVTAVAASPGMKIGVDIDLYKQGETMDDARLVFANQVDESFSSTMGIPVVSGRDFTPADTLQQIIINETAAAKLGLDIREAPGQNLYTGDGNEVTVFPIVGVIKDFNFSSLHEEVKPLFFQYKKNNNHLIVATQSGNYPEVLARLETTWKSIIPQEPFAYSVLDENIQQQYETESTLLRIINSFTLLAILICCLGLFGLVAFNVEQRTKEIGIRKVLGASVSSVTILISTEFVKLVLISITIASPVAWLLMNSWLSDFAYRTDIEWWVFVIAGVLAVSIALITVSFHAVKAAMDNPVKSLRSE